MTKAELTGLIRRRLERQIFDDSGVDAQTRDQACAIYTLSDPRELRLVRYVGQTQSPQRRYLQHLNTAKLWLPDAVPWWVKSDKLRPLYSWIRELYGDGARLPVMVIVAWVDPAHRRQEERNHIFRCLQEQLPLLNFERQNLGSQIVLT